jgi:hypothetical protein
MGKYKDAWLQIYLPNAKESSPFLKGKTTLRTNLIILQKESKLIWVEGVISSALSNSRVPSTLPLQFF